MTWLLIACLNLAPCYVQSHYDTEAECWRVLQSRVGDYDGEVSYPEDPSPIIFYKKSPAGKTTEIWTGTCAKNEGQPAS